MDTSAKLRRWLASAAYRYTNDDQQLIYAAAAYLASLEPLTPKTAATLYYAQRVVLKDKSFSLSACRSAITRLAQASASPSSPSGAWRAAAQVVGLALAPLPKLSRGQLAAARRAIVVIGLTGVAERQRLDSMTHVIVSARWLALKLGISIQGAANIINALVDAEILVGQKLLRDQRTRAFRLRPLTYVERMAAELAWGPDTEQVLTYVADGTLPTPSSVADVIVSASSPMHTADGVPGGVWVTALSDAARTQARAARDVGRRMAGKAAGTRRSRRVGRELESMYLWPKTVGAPVKPAAARRWLAERPADVALVEWLSQLAEENGVQAAADERAAAFARERRAARRTADLAMCDVRRGYRTPEEFAVAVLERVGEPPVDLTAARAWLPRVAEATAQISGRVTIPQGNALRDAVRRVLQRAGMDSGKSTLAARRVVGTPVADVQPVIVVGDVVEKRGPVRFEPVL